MLIWRGVGIGLQVLRPCWDLLASVRLLGVGRFCGERCTTTAAQPCHHIQRMQRTRPLPAAMGNTGATSAGGPSCVQACVRSGGLPSAAHLAAKAWPAQDDVRASREDAERREGLLPLALAATEAALRRTRDIFSIAADVATQARSCSDSMSVSTDGRACWSSSSCMAGVCSASATGRLQACLLQPITLDAAAGVQATAYGYEMMQAAGSDDIVSPAAVLAAKALLISLAKVITVVGLPLFMQTTLLVSRAGSTAAWAGDAAHRAHVKGIGKARQSPPVTSMSTCGRLR